ncbi:MAG: hypothetical protein CMG85_01090 [Marinobacter sp.]|jgi:hypothetical protein|nr:hypothetical protein [Marinobacter sp.]|tara:strand:+ start:700 stop:966 length:267 start_codon:yes stop_codon:yes gene_type:complete
MYQFGASWGSSSRTHEAEIDLKTVARHAVETGQLKPQTETGTDLFETKIGLVETGTDLFGVKIGLWDENRSVLRASMPTGLSCWLRRF